MNTALVAILIEGEQFPIATTAQFTPCTAPLPSPPPLENPFLIVSSNEVDFNLLSVFEYQSNVALSSYQMSLFANGSPLEIELAFSLVIGIDVVISQNSANTIVATSIGNTIIPPSLTNSPLFEVVVKLTS